MNQSFNSKAVTIWLYTGIVMILMMVVIGGITRLTHSGLSMVQWTFAGSLPPSTEAGWHAEFDLYKTSPEYKELNTHFTLSDFKSIYWWEYIHRMFGRLIGLVFIIPFAWFLIKRSLPRWLVGRLFIVLGLGFSQALLGWFMVKSGLVDVPRVSHYRLAAHLSTAFITCCYIYWVINEVRYGHKVRGSGLRGLKVARGLLAIIGLQIVWGAFVAGLKAGLIHNTWPLMDGQVISDAATAMSPWVVNFLENKSGVQFVHRTWGIIALLAVGWAYLKRFALFETAGQRLAISMVALLVTVQFILGILTLLMHVPLLLGVLHQIVALILLLSLVRLLFTSKERYSI